ncbi:accessory gland protein Acp29AB-like [Drosophila gunungcola]|uniref:accessory gland protein Acp29AB-like n=1 Tax=Drosophila gunungcola TaxID=103775 RepID=UPI0022E2ECE3|nr:accessory gland protein Acp29AB-like [Drosophila gunungcola]
MFRYKFYILFAFFVLCDLYKALAEIRNHQCPEITPHDTLKESEEVCLVELSPVFEHIANQKRIENGGEYLFNETQGVLDRIEDHQEVIRKQLMALQDRIEIQLKKLLDKMDLEVQILSQKKSLEEASNALRHSLELKKVSVNVIVISQFEKLGSRYFYIEKSVGLDWFSAARQCREMGGHLAAPKDEDELNLIRQKLDSRRYWLDINDLPNKDEYISLASGEAAPFLKWNKGEPLKNPNAHCVYIYDGHYYKYFCIDRNLFVCQAEDPKEHNNNNFDSKVESNNTNDKIHNNTKLNIGITININLGKEKERESNKKSEDEKFKAEIEKQLKIKAEQEWKRDKFFLKLFLDLEV